MATTSRGRARERARVVSGRDNNIADEADKEGVSQGTKAISDFSRLPPPERRAVLEGLAVTLADTAELAASEGEDALEMVMRSVGAALREAAGDLAATDVALAEDVAVRAMSLIMTFHARHPHLSLEPTLH